MGKCGYCGKEIADNQTHCQGCGTPTLETEAEAGQPKKSKPWAITLALVFGPLGLLYLGFEGVIVIVFILGLSFALLPILLVMKAGIWINIFVRIGCAAYVAQAVDERNGTANIRAEANECLDEAARLENINMGEAITKYEEIIHRYPGSSASMEAQRNIETLRKSLGHSANSQE